jgi:hypothetical protein
MHQETSEMLAAISVMLHAASLLSLDEMKVLMTDGVLAAAGRIHIGRAYREMYHEFTDADCFGELQRRATEPVEAGREFRGPQHSLLTAKSGAGPTYAQDEATRSIELRYERCIRSVGFTVRRLMADQDRRSFLLGWHREGLKDWEILSIIANVAANTRQAQSDEDTLSDEALLERYKSAFEFAEDVDSALSPDLFEDEVLRMYRRVYQAAYLRSWRLDFHVANLGEKEIEHFLIERYGLRDDDVDHPDVFGWGSIEGPVS